VNWDAIGAIGEIVGAVAVVATLGYLAVQIRQSTRVARAEISQRMSEQVQNIDVAILSNPDAAELLDRVGSDVGQIQGPDFWRWTSFALARIDHAENLFYQYRAGTLDSSRLDSLMVPIHYSFRAMPRLRGTWISIREYFDPEFRKYMDSVLESIEGDA